jgi:hypothetical protein
MKKSIVMTKIQSMVFVLLVFCIFPVFGAECGDVDSSGDIGIVDALLIAQYYVNLNPSNFDSSVADVNGDGNITITDALFVARYYVNLISSFPGCSETPAPTAVPVDTPGPTSVSTTVTFQAEDAYFSRAEVESGHSGYTGSGYVNTDNTTGPYIEWYLNASTNGNAECVFRYANSGSSRPMELAVNGNTVVSSLDFPGTGGWSSWSTVNASISLNSGANTIRLTSLDAEGAPNLDKLDISFNGTLTIPEPTPVPTADPNGLFVDTYVPENNRDLWEEYIVELDYRVETGGNGGSRTIYNPILVRQGTTYDGRGETLNADKETMGDSTQDEDQKPYFLLEPGATVKNVTFGNNGVEGIHCMGDNTIENVHWQDIGEDALSVRSYFPGGDITITNGSAYDGADKCFQFNSECVVRITDFQCARVGKFIRQNGGTTFRLTIYLDTVTVNDFKEAIVRSDSPNCYVYYRNIRSNESESDWWMLETTPRQF